MLWGDGGRAAGQSQTAGSRSQAGASAGISSGSPSRGQGTEQSSLAINSNGPGESLSKYQSVVREGSCSWDEQSRRRLCGWGVRVLIAAAVRHANEVVGTSQNGVQTGAKTAAAHALAPYDTLVLALSVLANAAEGSLAARAAMAATGVPLVAAPWMRVASIRAQSMVDRGAYPELDAAMEGMKEAGGKGNVILDLGPGYKM